MLKRKYMIIGFLAFCLTATLFLGTTTNSATTSLPEPYDPWYDVNDDGKINIKDIGHIAIRFGTNGTAINKTALLLELLDRVEALETGGFIGAPAYDSDWKNISKGKEIILEHNCCTTDVLVYMIGKYDDASPYIHQMDYGGLSDYQGARWKDLTATTITVHRRSNDNNWNYVRVMIWKIQPLP